MARSVEDWIELENDSRIRFKEAFQAQRSQRPDELGDGYEMWQWEEMFKGWRRFGMIHGYGRPAAPASE